MDRTIGKLLGTDGGAASSTLGQVLTSAEIEEVTIAPKPLRTISGVFWNYLADSNSIFVAAEFFF